MSRSPHMHEPPGAGPDGSAAPAPASVPAQALLDALPYPAFLTGDEVRPCLANELWLEGLAERASQLLTAGPDSLCHAEDLPGLHVSWRIALQTGSRMSEKVRLRTTRGVYERFALTLSPMRGPEGGIEAWLGVALEVEAYEEDREALRRATEMLDQAGALGELGYWETDWSRRRSSWSPVMFRIFGLQPGAEGLGPLPDEQFFRRVVHPEDLEAVLEAQDRVLQGHEPVKIHLRIIRPDGAERRVQCRARGLRDSAGKLVRVVGIATDTTEEYAQASELRRQRDLFEQLFDHMPVFLALVDESGRTLKVNRELRQALGYSEQEWNLTATFAKAFRDGQTGLQSWRALLPAGGGWVGMHVWDRRGKLLEVSWTMADLPGAAALVIGRDVTESNRLEQNLRQALKLEAVGRLAGGVAHDFNNILTVILGYCELLRSDAELDPNIRSFVEQVHEAGERAAALTRHLLAFSRRQVLQPGLLDLNAVIRGMEKMARRLIWEHVELAIDLKPVVLPVVADRSQLEQVLLNLMLNARDAVSKGGRIAVKTSETTLAHPTTDCGVMIPTGRYAVFSVSDNGVGMDEHTLALIFEPFFTTKPEGMGTGLGLATVYGIIRQSDGYIAVETAEGAGTTFRVYLPRAEAAQPAPAPVAQLATPELPPASVLLVEDDESVRTLVRRTLGAAGCEVFDMPDPASALRFLAHYSGHIDLLISDLVMPGMDGYALAEEVLSQRAEVRTLILTGYHDAVVRPLANGQRPHVLAKPFSSSALCEVLARLLAGQN